MADEEVQEEEGGLRSQMWKHEAMVEWINSEEEVDLDTLSAAEVIAYAFARRVAWRKSEVYQNLVAERQTAAEAEKAAKAEAREAAAAARAEEKAAAKAAKAEKAEKGAAPAKAAKKATKATKATKKGAASGGDENPFG